MFKFVHIADVHLDSPIVKNVKHKEIILEAISDAFKQAVKLCIDNKCHAFIIAGDLFDDMFTTFKSELMLRDSFKKLENNNIQVFYALGNHDPKSSNLKKIRWGDNVHIFDDENSEIVEVKDADGKLLSVVIGVGYSEDEKDEKIIGKYPNILEEVPVVGIFHAYDAVNYDVLKSKSYDYWALGHIHKKSIVNEDTRPIVFPGCISGRDWGETGEKGAYLITLEKRTNPKCEFIPLSNVKWQEIEISGFFQDVTDAAGVVDVCLDYLKDLDNKVTNFVRITLAGECALYNLISLDDIKSIEEELENKTAHKITIKNNLTSFVNPDDYKDDKHLLSMALKMTNQFKENHDFENGILDEIKEDYKDLEGKVDDEYVDLLLKDMERVLCDSMLKKDA